MAKQRKYIIAGITAALALGSFFIINNIVKRRRTLQLRQAIADEGYETAYDILYPLKSQHQRRYKVK